MKLPVKKLLPFATLGVALCTVCGARADAGSLDVRDFGAAGDSSYIWAWKGKPFKDIALRNVDLNGGLEVIW